MFVKCAGKLKLRKQKLKFICVNILARDPTVTTVTDVKVKKEIKTEASTAEELINQEDTKAEPGVETDLSVEEAIVTAKPKLKIKVGRKSKNVKKRKLKKDIKGKGKIGIVFKKKACEEEKPSKQFSEICHVCGKLYRSETGLKYHVREHIGIYKYTCDQCPKKFNFKNAFLAHQQVHTGVNIYRCDMCSKSFHNKSNLGRHSKICTENLSFKIFTCDKCGKCFKSKSYLNDHIKRHALTGGGNKSYHCPKCNSSYFHRTSLYRHFQKTGHNI